MDSFSLILMILISGGIYLLPSIIAYYLKHENLSAVIIFNIVAGWILIGYLITLAYALFGKRNK